MSARSARGSNSYCRYMRSCTRKPIGLKIQFEYPQCEKILAHSATSKSEASAKMFGDPALGTLQYSLSTQASGFRLYSQTCCWQRLLESAELGLPGCHASAHAGAAWIAGGRACPRTTFSIPQKSRKRYAVQMRFGLHGLSMHISRFQGHVAATSSSTLLQPHNDTAEPCQAPQRKESTSSTGPRHVIQPSWAHGTN